MLYIAWKKDDTEQKFRKPTRAERVQALADHLLEKWKRQDRIKAEQKYGKIKSAPATNRCTN